MGIWPFSSGMPKALYNTALQILLAYFISFCLFFLNCLVDKYYCIAAFVSKHIATPETFIQHYSEAKLLKTIILAFIHTIMHVSWEILQQ